MSTASNNHGSTSGGQDGRIASLPASAGSPQEENPILQPTDMDVLCGRDKNFSKHEGNQLFRNQILSYAGKYQKAIGKPAKMRITKEVVYNMQNKYNSRFLRRIDAALLTHGKETQLQWEEISNQLARDKVSHALRFAARSMATKTTTSDGSSSHLSNKSNHSSDGASDSDGSMDRKVAAAPSSSLESDCNHQRRRVAKRMSPSRQKQEFAHARKNHPSDYSSDSSAGCQPTSIALSHILAVSSRMPDSFSMGHMRAVAKTSASLSDEDRRKRPNRFSPHRQQQQNIHSQQTTSFRQNRLQQDLFPPSLQPKLPVNAGWTDQRDKDMNDATMSKRQQEIFRLLQYRKTRNSSLPSTPSERRSTFGSGNRWFGSGGDFNLGSFNTERLHASDIAQWQHAENDSSTLHPRKVEWGNDDSSSSSSLSMDSVAKACAAAQTACSQFPTSSVSNHDSNLNRGRRQYDQSIQCLSQRHGQKQKQQLTVGGHQQEPDFSRMLRNQVAVSHTQRCASAPCSFYSPYQSNNMERETAVTLRPQPHVEAKASDNVQDSHQRSGSHTSGYINITSAATQGQVGVDGQMGESSQSVEMCELMPDSLEDWDSFSAFMSSFEK